MKKRSVASFLTLLFLSACSVTSPSKDYDFTIMDGQKAVLVVNQDGKLKKISEKIIGDKPVDIDREKVFEDEKFVYGKTSWENPQTMYLFKLDKEQLKADFLDLKGYSSYTSTFDGTYYYSTAVFTDRIEFFKYDQDFKQVATSSYPNSNKVNSTTDLFVRGDKLYLLAGVLDKETNIVSNELWMMNKDFKIEEQIDIDYTEKSAGAFYSVAQVDNKLYMTEVWDGSTNSEGEPNGGNSIAVYDLDTRQTDVIHLETTYPKFIRYDADRHLLQVQHDVLYTKDTILTFIDVKTGQQKTVTIDQSSDSEPYFTEINGEYYYLFNEKLVIYNYDTNKKVVYNLSDIGVKSADILVGNGNSRDS